MRLQRTDRKMPTLSAKGAAMRASRAARRRASTAARPTRKPKPVRTTAGPHPTPQIAPSKVTAPARRKRGAPVARAAQRIRARKPALEAPGGRRQVMAPPTTRWAMSMQQVKPVARMATQTARVVQAARLVQAELAEPVRRERMRVAMVRTVSMLRTVRMVRRRTLPTRSNRMRRQARHPIPASVQQITALVEGESLTFTSQFGPVNWSVAADDAATPGTVTAGGVYTAPATPGTFHVVGTSQADAQRSAVATVTVVPASALPTLSGSITDTVGGQGRIYVMASGEAGTVSLAAPGAYAIHGVSEGPGQSVTLFAYRDVLGVGTYVEAVDPYASTMVTWNGSSISGIDLALGAPPALPAQVAPDKVQVFTMDHGALVVWSHNGQETVDHYRVYASANANPLADAQAVVRTVRAGTSPIAIVDPLVNGVTYFALATVRQTIEGPATIVGPFTVGPPAAQWAVSGTIDFGGPPHPAVRSMSSCTVLPSPGAQRRLARGPTTFRHPRRYRQFL